MGRLQGTDNRLVAFGARSDERVSVTRPGEMAGGLTQINNITFTDSRGEAPADVSSQSQQAARLGAVLSRQRANR